MSPDQKVVEHKVQQYNTLRYMRFRASIMGVKTERDFRNETMTTATKTRNEVDEEADSGLVADVEEKIKDKGLVARIKDRIQERAERNGVELPDGCAISSIAAQFLRGRSGAECIGTELGRFAKEQDGCGGGRGVWVPYRSDKHAGQPSKLVITEYLLSPATDADMRVPAGVQRVPQTMVWRIHNGKLEGPLGRRIATIALRRMADHGLLSAVGERLLAEQTGTPKPDSEESTIGASATK
jgi:hypothetical protein